MMGGVASPHPCAAPKKSPAEMPATTNVVVGSTAGIAALLVAVAISTWLLTITVQRLRHAPPKYKVRADLATQQRLRGIIAETGMGFWETEVGSDSVFVSDTYARMLGLERDAHEALSMLEWFALIHPDDVPLVGSAIADVGNSREGSSLYRLEYRARHTRGHYLWVLSLGAVAERHADGMPFLVVGTLTDITEQKHVQLALAASEQNFRSLFEQVPVGIALTDFHSHRFLNVNDALLHSTGYTREELLHEVTYSQLARSANDRLLERPVDQREQELTRKDGTSFPALVSGSKMRTADGREVVWSVIHDISERKAAERALTFAANFDRLTGLANRAQFTKQLDEARDRVACREQPMLAVLFLDFDRFKFINDAMGHLAGDHLLVQIAARLRAELHPREAELQGGSRSLIARFGGDEFLILLNDIGSVQDAMSIAARLQRQLGRSYTIQDREVQSTVSIGVTTSDSGSDSADAVICNADVAMYEAKRGGRARTVLFDPSMHERLKRHVALESGLGRALANDEFSLVFQPIVDLATGERTAIEALLRWDHPQLGAISPSEFVPIAEESGQILQIGAWVLRESLSTLERLRKADPVRAPKRISVNLSRAELAQ
ncbi:MAG: diguanylate cyclase, partial [Burkholderiales bacterium]